MSSVLTLKGVSKAYNAGKPNEVSVLDGVDFEVAKGEVVGLIAPSGAGKSTFLHIAGLLDTADAGQVIIDGQDHTDLSDAKRTKTRRQDVGFVYQFHHLLPEFTATENLMLPQMANGLNALTAERRATELLAWVGLEARAKHRPSELSGGEQQRVAFCRALANGPKLLLADEPTGNLDPDTADRVFEALMQLVRETGMSAVIATHNHDLAHRMDRQVALRQGQIVPA
jgi:lipoprotein-releasing system ATP-binding protein